MVHRKPTSGINILLPFYSPAKSTDSGSSVSLKCASNSAHNDHIVLSHQFCLLHQYLPEDLHVVCVDMPGHDGTSRTGPEDYSIQGQVRRIHQVCTTSAVRVKVHLRGLFFPPPAVISDP